MAHRALSCLLRFDLFTCYTLFCSCLFTHDCSAAVFVLHAVNWHFPLCLFVPPSAAHPHISPLNSPWRACSAPSPPTPWTRWCWAVRSLAPITLIPGMMSGSPSVTLSPCSCLRMARYWTPEGGQTQEKTCIKPIKSTYTQDYWPLFNSTSCLFSWSNRAEITPVTWLTLWWSRHPLKAPQTATAHRWASTPLLVS